MTERFRAGFGQRAVAIALALLLEALLVLALLTLGRGEEKRETVEMSTFSLSPDITPEAEQPSPEPSEVKAETTPAPPKPQPEKAVPQPEPPTPQPAPVAPPLVQFSRELMAAADISTMRPAPTAPAKQPTVMGPADSGTPGDTPRVAGTGPNGEPLYAASWYREPYPSELSGYLSTAQGPGWGLIACRTVPNYKVEDCVAVDEYPAGSNITRSALAAAWQFQVRPPRLGGRVKVGEWVRIRIDYQVRPVPAR